MSSKRSSNNDAPKGQKGATTTAWAPTTQDKTECQRCGGHVSAAWRRAAGDDNDTVFGCPNCYSDRELAHGAAKEGCDGERSYSQGGLR